MFWMKQRVQSQICIVDNLPDRRLLKLNHTLLSELIVNINVLITAILVHSLEVPVRCWAAPSVFSKQLIERYVVHPEVTFMQAHCESNWTEQCRLLQSVVLKNGTRFILKLKVTATIFHILEHRENAKKRHFKFILKSSLVGGNA